MLPQYRYKYKDRRDEDECQRNLRDGSRWERLDVDVGAGSCVVLLVPAGEGREEEECDKGKDKCDDDQVGEHYAVLEGVGHPDQVERIRIERYLFCEQSGVVGAQKAAIIWLNAKSKVSNPYFERCTADDVGDCCCNARVDLRWVVRGCVCFVVEGYEED